MAYKKQKQATDKFQLVTDKILTLMEQGTCIWKKPWHSTPYGNLVSGHQYQGINPLLCAVDVALNEWEYPLFVGFHQAKQKGWKIRKGSKSTWLRWGGTFCVDVENEETGEIQKTFKNAAKWHNVFNAACLDDSEAEEKIGSYLEKLQVTGTNTEPRINEAEALISAQEAKVSFGGNVACYSPSADAIRMPRYSDFTWAIAYYSTFLHEHVHWTGHPSRLNRSPAGQFGSRSYAYEELVAELGAAFVCNELCFDSKLEHHASYINHWVELLRGDKKAFFNAAAQARKAANLLLDNAGLNSSEMSAA